MNNFKRLFTIKAFKYLGYLFIFTSGILFLFNVRIPGEKNAIYFLGHWWDFEWEIKLPLLILGIIIILASLFFNKRKKPTYNGNLK